MNQLRYYRQIANLQNGIGIHELFMFLRALDTLYSRYVAQPI